MEQLEKEKQKIAKDVEQLKMKRQGTGNTPRLTPLPPSKTSDREKTDLYRIALLVREANKIAQHLKKETVSAVSFTFLYYDYYDYCGDNSME